MFMKFIEIYRKDQTKREYALRDIFINMEYVVSAVPEENIKDLMHECATAKLISEDANYTRLFLARGNIGHEVVVVESFDTLVTKVANIQAKTLKNVLKG